MDVVRELTLSSDSNKVSNNSESSDIEILDSSDICHSQSHDQPLSSSFSLIQTDQREESGGSDISTSQKKGQSLLDVLKCPQPSTLARKQTIVTNNPPTGKRSCKSTNQGKAAASIKPQQRVAEFKGEHLCVSSGKLFCNACREEVNLKKSSVKNHI